MTTLLLIAHGSRQAEANDDLHQLVAALRARGGFGRVEPAFLELAEPTIPQALDTCLAGAAQRIVMMPYFLSAGVHVRKDLQGYRDDYAARHPHVEFVLAEPLGRHPLLLDVVLQRIAEAQS